MLTVADRNDQRFFKPNVDTPASPKTACLACASQPKTFPPDTSGTITRHARVVCTAARPVSKTQQARNSNRTTPSCSCFSTARNFHFNTVNNIPREYLQAQCSPFWNKNHLLLGAISSASLSHATASKGTKPRVLSPPPIYPRPPTTTKNA